MGVSIGTPAWKYVAILTYGFVVVLLFLISGCCCSTKSVSDTISGL